MKVSVRYFASLREALGAGEAVDMPDGGTVAGLRALLQSRGGAHASVLADDRAVRCAVDQVLSPPSTVLTSGAEVAFFPPVTGG